MQRGVVNIFLWVREVGVNTGENSVKFRIGW